MDSREQIEFPYPRQTTFHHGPSGIPYLCSLTHFQILVGFHARTKTQFWYQLNEGEIHLGRLGSDLLKMEDIDAEETRLLPHFEGAKLDTMEDRIVMYKKFEDLCKVIRQNHATADRLFPPDPDSLRLCEDYTPVCMKARRVRRVFEEKFKQLFDTASQLCNWIADSTTSLQDPYLPIIFEGSPVTAFEDFEPDDAHLESGVSVAMDSFFRQDFNAVARFIHHESFDTIDRVTQLLRYELGQIWYELYRGLAFLRLAKPNPEHPKLKSLMRSSITMLQEWSDGITALRNDSLISVIDDLKCSFENEELQIWWQITATNKKLRAFQTQLSGLRDTLDVEFGAEGEDADEDEDKSDQDDEEEGGR
ncbi:hypothetical protein BKA81DRAFT_430410 [Phyllosticta paracitricarpa]